MSFLSCVCYAFVHVCLYLMVTYWERAGLLPLVCGVSLYVLSLSHWYPGLIVSIPDLCTLTYFCYLACLSLKITGDLNKSPTRFLLILQDSCLSFLLLNEK